LTEAALPVWSREGVEPGTGAFVEALTLDGQVRDPRRRTRVQARQAFVFASAARFGLMANGLSVARRGFDLFLARTRRADGLFIDVLTPSGELQDPTASLYEQAFVLLALSALARASPDDPAPQAEACALRERLAAFRHGEGFREAGEQPFQANAQMHLLEAALAWRDISADPAWSGLADQIARLALSRLIDPMSGALREIFDADWRAITGRAGAVEPGHQFEWAWLLKAWGAPDDVARGLYRAGRRGLDAGRGVIVDRLWDDLSIRDRTARLWPQTEFLRAAVAMGETQDALTAANAVGRFLETPLPGVWRERMDAEGRFLEQPAPATSLYHLTTAILALSPPPAP
jgi:mannose-6-phosphate isomerase